MRRVTVTVYVFLPVCENSCNILNRKDPEYDYVFKGCPCLEDLDFSQETPPQIRPYFGIGITKMNRVPDFEYGAGPKTEDKTQIKSDPVEGDVNGLDDFGGLDCPDLEMEHFRCSDCGGSDDLGKSKGVGIHGCVISSPKLTCQDPEWEHEFQGCECLEDPDWSTEIPGLKRPNFGKGLAKLAKLPDIKYVSPPGFNCPAEGTIDQPESSDDTGCAGIYGKCTKGEHEGCSCKELEWPDVEKEQFRCGECRGMDDQGKCKGVSAHLVHALLHEKLTQKDPEYDYEFKGCDCTKDLDFSNHIPGQVRPYFGIGRAKMDRVPDFQYAPVGSVQP